MVLEASFDQETWARMYVGRQIFDYPVVFSCNEYRAVENYGIWVHGRTPLHLVLRTYRARAAWISIS